MLCRLKCSTFAAQLNSISTSICYVCSATANTWVWLHTSAQAHKVPVRTVDLHWASALLSAARLSLVQGMKQCLQPAHACLRSQCARTASSCCCCCLLLHWRAWKLCHSEKPSLRMAKYLREEHRLWLTGVMLRGFFGSSRKLQECERGEFGLASKGNNRPGCSGAG